MQRNFALDCFRALAIMLVFTGHTVHSFGSPAYLYPLQFGGTGVDLFFVLSGWLIGTQLFKEQCTFGNIQVRRFWVRRWMRTMPAYYAVLFLTIFQQYLTKENFNFPWLHLVFLQNYQVDLQFFYISWSLALEEQFYLLIAPLLVFTFRFSKMVQGTILCALLFVPSLFRYFDLYQSLNQTHVRLDCCAMGIFLAYLKHSYKRLWLTFSTGSKWVFPLALATYFFFFVAWYNKQWNVPEPSKLFLAALFGIWIIWSDSNQLKFNEATSKLVMHISTRSYAMYLLHVDALVITQRFFSENVNFIVYYLIALFITLVGAEVLYRLIETPFMNARKYFSLSKPRMNIEPLFPKTEGLTK